MAWNPFRPGADRQLAETKYAGRESATDRAARARRTGHRLSVLGAARADQAWDDADRADERQRRGRYRR